MLFPFSSETPVSDSQLYLCSAMMLLFKWQDGMEHVSGKKIPKVKQTQAGFGQSVLLQGLEEKKAQKNGLALMCYFHSQGKTCSVLRGILCPSISDLCFQLHIDCSSVCRLVMTQFE